MKMDYEQALIAILYICGFLAIFRVFYNSENKPPYPDVSFGPSIVCATAWPLIVLIGVSAKVLKTAASWWGEATEDGWAFVAGVMFWTSVLIVGSVVYAYFTFE